MFCWLGIWTFTDTEVLFQLLESAAPRVAYPWPSSVPWRMRERLWPRGALRPHCAGQGEPVCRRGSVSPSRGVMPSQEVVGASLPSPPPRAVLCFVCAEKTVLGLRGSVSCSGEPFAWEPGRHCSWPPGTVTCRAQREHLAKSVFSRNSLPERPACVGHNV